MYQPLYEAVRKRGIPARGVTATPETNIIAAGLAAGGAIWTYRNPEANTRPILLTYLRSLTFTVTAFGTAVTPGRGLDLVRLTPNAPGTSDPSGGNAFTPVRVKSNAGDSLGVGRIADTGALTITGFTASARMHKHDMSNNGAANSGASNIWQLALQEQEIWLLPGEAVALVASQLMDATGTFRLLADFAAVEFPD